MAEKHFQAFSFMSLSPILPLLNYWDFFLIFAFLNFNFSCCIKASKGKIMAKGKILTLRNSN